ncbi:NUDIX hydrolase [Gryllotalpicola sp.]|uniref:NUDIX domain-containing protein n=1 Tax=Gryllotalpicola sp. TaxID=1932787 RepID=UPI00261F8618|nr:NUDIX hydrolase [Gryllotalpicola sp.]
MADALLADEPEEHAILDREVIFEGHILGVVRERFHYLGRELQREFVEHPGAVAVLALDEHERVLVIKQYRHPVRYREWEIPAGLLDFAGESAFAAAQRELAEEADLVATDWHLLGEFLTTPGGSNEAIRIYLARGLSATPEPFPREDEEADMERRWVGLDELVDGVLARRLQNPSLVGGVLAAAASRARDWVNLGSPEEPWTRHPRLDF